MSTLRQGLSQQVQMVIQERGAPVVLRPVTKTIGPAPLQSPPILVNAAVDGAVAAGAGYLAVRATSARGIIKLGDILTILGVPHVVAADAQSRPASANMPGFDAIQIASAPAAIPDGSAITPSWATDVQCYGMIDGFPRRLIDGTMILASDLSVLIPAYNIAEPQPEDRIVVAGRERTIVATTPVYVQDEVIQWQIQAR